MAGFAVAAGQMGENITTQGLDLLGLPTGARFHLDEAAVVEVTGLRNPCAQLDRIQPGLMAATLSRDEHGVLVRKAGIMAVVLTGGEVRTVYPTLAVGDQVAKIEVSAAVNAIETSSSNVSRSVEEKTLSEVPMVGRNAYASIAALAPGVTGSGQLFASGAAFGTDSFQAEPGYQINAACDRSPSVGSTIAT